MTPAQPNRTSAPGSVPPGVQPERNGRLQCLECGRWFRHVGIHVAQKHELTADDYRAKYELPRSKALAAPEIIERQVIAGKERFARDPNLRDLLTPKMPHEEVRKLALAARSESAKRAGSKEAGRRGTQEARQKFLDKLDAPYAEVARRLGMTGITELLDSTRDLTDNAFGRLTGFPTKQAARFRRRHGVVAPYVARKAAREAELARAGHTSAGPPAPGDVPLGVQPERSGRLQCLECGRWFRHLGNHIPLKHEMTADDYRAKYELPRTKALAAADILEGRVAIGRAKFAQDPQELLDRLTPKRPHMEVIRLALAVRKEDVRAATRESRRARAREMREMRSARLDEQFTKIAWRLGMTDIPGLLESTRELSDNAFAVLTGVTPGRARAFRRRHHIPTPYARRRTRQ